MRIRTLFAIGATASILSAPTVLAQFSKSTIQSQISSQFPDQNTGAITPATTRAFLNNLVNSYQQFTSVNPQAGTTYRILSSDYGALVTFNSAAAVAVSLSPPSTTGFNPFNTFVENLSTGNVVITPNGATINGASALTLSQNGFAWIVSDGTNYQTYGVLAANSITNSQLANMAASSVKCNDSLVSASPSDCAHIAFYLHKNNITQSNMTNSNYSQVTWATAKFNSGGGTFNSNRWTAPQPGFVFMNASLFYTANLTTSNLANVVVKIIKNSAGTCNGTDVFAGVGDVRPNTTGFGEAQANGVDQASTGDVYEVCSFGVSISGLNNIQLDGNPAHTHWSGAYMR